MGYYNLSKAGYIEGGDPIDVFNKLDTENLYQRNLRLRRPLCPSYWEKEMVRTPISLLFMVNEGHVYDNKILVKRHALSYFRDMKDVVVDDWRGRKIFINMDNVRMISNDYEVVTAFLYSDNTNYERGNYSYSVIVREGVKVDLVD